MARGKKNESSTTAAPDVPEAPEPKRKGGRRAKKVPEEPVPESLAVLPESPTVLPEESPSEINSESVPPVTIETEVPEDQENSDEIANVFNQIVAGFNHQADLLQSSFILTVTTIFVAIAYIYLTKHIGVDFSTILNFNMIIGLLVIVVMANSLLTYYSIKLQCIYVRYNP